MPLAETTGADAASALALSPGTGAPAAAASGAVAGAEARDAAVVQIDDGWQKGRSANSAKGKGVWNGYWAADPDFWQPDARRFPGGLAPVVRAATRGAAVRTANGPASPPVRSAARAMPMAQRQSVTGPALLRVTKDREAGTPQSSTASSDSSSD